MARLTVVNAAASRGNRLARRVGLYYGKQELCQGSRGYDFVGSPPKLVIVDGKPDPLPSHSGGRPQCKQTEGESREREPTEIGHDTKRTQAIYLRVAIPESEKVQHRHHIQSRGVSRKAP